jgi:hypothetical protein
MYMNGFKNIVLGILGWLVIALAIYGVLLRYGVDISFRPRRASWLAGENKGDESRRHVDKAGGFSFIPPDTWTVRDVPGLKFKYGGLCKPASQPISAWRIQGNSR